MKKIITTFIMMLCAVCGASAANYLTFTAEEDSSTFGIMNNKNTPDVQYSLDDGATWTALTEGDSVILAHKGDKALLKGNNPQGFSNRGNYSFFTMTGKVSASGSVMSLIDGTGLSTEIPNGYCFYSLFMFCTSLTRAPELPATTLTAFCYNSMFLGCTSLTQVPALPATTLANGCYDGMFARCTSLTQAPALPATTLADSCYMYMFSGCTSLSEIHVSFDDWRNADYSTAYWVKNVAPSGTFICPENLPLEYGYGGEDRIPEGWRVKKVIDGDTVDMLPVNRDLLTFTAEEDSSTFGIVYEWSGLLNYWPNIQYSLDEGETWSKLAIGDIIILEKKGDKALIRGYNENGMGHWSTWEHDGTESNYQYNYTQFVMTGAIAASGSVMSLIDGIGKTLVVPSDKCFFSLFSGCTSLTKAPELPATSLASNCYSEMFSGCTSLTNAPELPATTLEGYCYEEMFSGCTSLTNAPELPATSLASCCYSGMFKSCTSLTQAPELPATTLAGACYKSMFSGCTSLTNAPELPATKLSNSCYSGMFSSCTSLTNAPNLPATSLEWNCYSGMFSGCTSLTNAPELPATTLEGYCYEEMFSGCTSLTNAPNLPVTTLASHCYSGMFSGCTNLTKAPELPATSLASNCYSGMFSGCTSLTNAPNLPATSLAYGCYRSMFSGCTSLTKAPELPATTLAGACYESMFLRCTSLTNAPNLPATTLEWNCYEEMFSGCTNLSEISVDFTKWGSGHTDFWVENVAPTGTFYCPKELPLEYGVDRIPEGWTVKHIEVGVNATLADNITIWSDDLTIYVRGAKGEVSIYDLSGKRVAVSYSADEERALSVPAKGVYVVRTNNGTSDVLVR